MAAFDSFEDNLGEINKSELFSVFALFVFFTLFVNIIMLNLLIALMSNIYEKIQENAKAEFMFAKASIVLEFEAGIKEKASWYQLKSERRSNTEWFPDWLQVLAPSQGNASNEKLGTKEKEMLKKIEEIMSDRLEVNEVTPSNVDIDFITKKVRRIENRISEAKKPNRLATTRRASKR